MELTDTDTGSDTGTGTGILKVDFHAESKDPKKPELNEDRYVIVPGKAYAIIDGVSDKSGMHFDGETGGQIAGRIIEDVIRDSSLCGEDNFVDVEKLMMEFEVRFSAAARTYGIDEIGGAQLVLVLENKTHFRFCVIGDAGLRINGEEVFRANFTIDRICANIRAIVWYFVDGAGADAATCDKVARAYAVNGLGTILGASDRLIDENTLADLRSAVIDAVAGVNPEISPRLLEKAVREGLRIQPIYANRIHEFGFPCINGGQIPREYVTSFDRRRSEIETIELFSDGYFECPKGRTIVDWENHFQHVEAIDPKKLDEFRSTKGSSADQFSDDRTVVIIKNPTFPARKQALSEMN